MPGSLCGPLTTGIVIHGVVLFIRLTPVLEFGFFRTCRPPVNGLQIKGVLSDRKVVEL